MNRAVGAVALALCLGLVAWGLWPRRPVRDEDLVRGVISDCAKAAGEHDLTRVMSHVGDGYRGEFGDRLELRSAIGAYMFSARDVTVVDTKVEVTVTGPAAQADFVLVLARLGSTGPEGNLGSRKVHASLAKGPDGWQFVAAQSREAGASDFLP